MASSAGVAIISMKAPILAKSVDMMPWGGRIRKPSLVEPAYGVAGRALGRVPIRHGARVAPSDKSGPIVTVESRAGTNTEYDAGNEAIVPRPLAVLVNHFTASASEITAGAVQDYGAGTIVGEKTFGKGVVQSLYTLPDKGALKITTARYVTPKGRDIQHKGIVPDVVVAQPVDQPILRTPRDKQLAEAKRIIESKRDQQ